MATVLDARHVSTKYGMHLSKSTYQRSTPRTICFFSMIAPGGQAFVHTWQVLQKSSAPNSMGGIYIRDYATRYPEEVRGLIFVDASTPLQGQTPPFKKVKQSPQRSTMLLTRLAYITNFPRLAGTCSLSRPGSESPAWRLLAEGLCHPQFRATRDEGNSFDLSRGETIQTGSYGALPILIFSHDPAKTKQVTNWETSWSQLQEDLKKLSTRSRRIVARNSTHYVQLDRAQLAVKEVSLFIEQIRGTTPLSSNYGSTITA